MNSRTPYRFIVTPLNGQRYVNTKTVGETSLIVNTSIEDAKDVNRIGVVLSIPLNYDGDVQVGDQVVVHHNTFRVHYCGQGVPRESDAHMKDDLFGLTPDLVYLIIRDGKKIASDENVFIKPIAEHQKWLGEQELKHIGIVRYANKTLHLQGIREGDKIAFHRDAEYQFEIDGERLYKMSNKRILAKINS